MADEALRALRGGNLSPQEQERVLNVAVERQASSKELANRVLMNTPPDNAPKPQDHAAWLARTEGDGDPFVGERIFFHPRVGGCYRCHEFEGRGNQVGPDLTAIGRSMTRERLIQSIVDPSREIAPQFTSWTIRTVDGQVKTGLHVGDEIDGRIRFADAEGRTFHIHPDDIDERKPSEQSLMPERLADNLTPQELRDLVAFLLHAQERPQ
jgi:putative heme-binding domain-containing protein